MLLGRFSALALALCWSGLSLAAPPDPELEALKAEMLRLQARIEALEAARATDPVAATRQADAGDAVPAVAPPAPAMAGSDKASGASTADEKKLRLAGRVHTDVYAFDEDRFDLSGGAELRRARVEWYPQFGEWGADVVFELSGDGGGEGLRELMVHRSWGEARLQIGQFKPFRSMAEQTSSNSLVVPERPFLSASGVFSGRQFQQGIGILSDVGQARVGFSAFSLRDQGTVRNDGWGLAGRVTATPWRDADGLLHVGGWLSLERASADTPALRARVEYAGRRGPRDSLASTIPGLDDGAVDAAGLELAWQRGGWLLQSELGRVRYRDGTDSTELDSGYLQGSYLFNGAHRPYKSAAGAFNRPSLDGPAWELTARIDYIRVDGLPQGEVRSTVLGLNYHFSDHLHWLLSYTLGDSDVSNDQTRQLALRTQFIF